MDTSQYDWRRLPKWEQDTQHFFEDVAGDRTLLRPDRVSDVKYKYWSGEKPKENDEKRFWKKFSEEAMREEAGGWRARFKGLKKDGNRKRLAPDHTDDRMDKKTRYTHSAYTKLENDMDVQREVQHHHHVDGTRTPSFDPNEIKKKRKRFDDRGDSGDANTTPHNNDVILFENVPKKVESMRERELETQKILLQNVQKNPQDIEGWLGYARYMDNLQGMTRKGRVEKKISILESAIDSNEDSADLWAELAGVVSTTMGVDDTEQVWEAALTSTNGSFDAWKKLLAWKERCFKTFNVPTHRAAINKSMAKTHDDPTSYLDHLRDVATFEKSTGYIERGIALYQAAVAFALSDEEVTLEEFGEYWEGEGLRPGEAGYIAGKLDIPELQSEEESDEGSEKDDGGGGDTATGSRLMELAEMVHPREVYVKWLNLHRKRSKVQTTPLKITEHLEETTLNPERAVLYEDLEDCLPLRLPKTDVPTMLKYFLEFLGVPVFYGATGRSSCATTGDVLRSIFALESTEEAYDWVPGTTPFHNRGLLTVVRNVVRLGMEVFPGDEAFPLVSFYVEKSMNKEKGLEHCKKMLETREVGHPMLWLQYAVETPKEKVANKILKMLVAKGDLAAGRIYAEKSLQKSKFDEAYQIICTVAEGGGNPTSSSKKTPDRTLRAISALRRALSPDAASCLALLTACDGPDSHHRCLADFESHPVEKNRYYYVLYTRLLLTATSLTPSAKRRVLKTAGAANPGDPLFTFLYVQYEDMHGTRFNIRRFFTETAGGCGGDGRVYYWAALMEEVKFDNKEGALRWLEKGVAAANNSELLWDVYLQHLAAADGLGWEEVNVLKAELIGLTNPASRKKIQKQINAAARHANTVTSTYFRAISTLPCSLQTWIEGLSALLRFFSPSELRDVVDLMLERELHLRAFVEEVADALEGPARPCKKPQPTYEENTKRLAKEYAESRSVEDRKRMAGKVHA